MATEGAYRIGNGAPVTGESARAIWAAVAREVLEELRGSAGITHHELARQVQQRSGVYTRLAPPEWLPTVLTALDEPELVARVRTAAPPPPGRVRTKASSPRTPAPATPRKREEVPPALCPRCFMQLPATGRCDTCA
jgi:hypothetical protein